MNPSVANKLQSDIQNEVIIIQDIMKKHNNIITQKTKLITQQQENEMVKKELDLLNTTNNNNNTKKNKSKRDSDDSDDDERGDNNTSSSGLVYKLIGPVLIKQDLSEALINVGNRLKYIKSELERLDKLQKDYDNTKLRAQNNINQIQQTFKKLQQEAVNKATNNNSITQSNPNSIQ